MSSLENALQILDLLGPDRPVLRVGEACRDLELPKSSVSRLLRALSEAGLLEREEAGQGYVVGPGALRLGNLYLARHSLMRLIDEALGGLIAEFGFTGYASVLSGVDIVLLRLRQGAYPLRHVREIGARLPAWQTAMGAALLARLPDHAVRARFVDHHGRVPRTIGINGLLTRLMMARRDRFVLAPSQLTPGISTISTALLAPEVGDLVALAIAYPDTAVDPDLTRRMSQRLLEQAQAIGAQVGDPWWSNAAC